MRKLSKILIATLCFVFSGIWLVACGENSPTVKSLDIDTTTFNVTIEQGTDFDEWLKDIVVGVNYSDDTTQNLSFDDLTFSEFDTSILGEQNLIITYKGKSATIVIEVVQGLNSIEMVESTIPVALQYITPDVSGIKILAHFTDGDREISSGFTTNISSFNSALTGLRPIKVSYLGKEVTFNVNVLALTKIEINNKQELGDLRFVKDQAFNVSDYDTKIIATWSNGATKDVTSSSTVTLNTHIVGEADIVATFNNKTDSVTVGIVNNAYTVSGWEDPTFVSAWAENSNLQNAYNTTESQGQIGFTVTGNEYVVGSDNDFKFQPQMHAIEYVEDDFNPVTYTDFRTNVSAWFKDGTEYVELVKEDVNENKIEYYLDDELYLTINNNFKYDFESIANNNNFKIQVLPYYMTADEAETVGEGSVFEFRVVSGYNVYTAADLSVLDNTNAQLENSYCNSIQVNTSEYNSNGKWTNLKNANGIALNNSSTRLILHSNINVTMDDIPSIHYYEQDGENYLLDGTREDIGYIYLRKLASGESFALEGNYFTIDTTRLAKIIRERDHTSDNDNDHPVTSHTTLFKVLGVDNTCSFTMNNIQIMGNSPRSDNRSDWGGLIAMKFDTVNTNVDNMLAQRWFIPIMYEGKYEPADDVTNVLSNSNMFDSNNTIIYAWGARDLLIDNCHLIGAGGPVMICDHVSNNLDGTGGYPTNVRVNNSVLESWVAGTESWFVGYDAVEAAGEIKALDNLTTPFGRTIVKEHNEEGEETVYLMNIIAVFKSAEIEGFTATGINSSFEDISENADSERIYPATYKLNTLQYFGDYQTHLSTANLGGNIVVNMDGSPDMATVANTANQYAMANAETYLYINYLNGMAFILGIQPMPAPAE